MLGFPDPWVAWGYVLSILASLVCIIYGIIKWNKE